MEKVLKKSKVALALLLIFLVSCASPNSLNKKATEIAKSFYTEYLKADESSNRDKLLEIKKNYMTEVMVEEVDIRSSQIDADIVTGVQDATALSNKMVVTEGENDEWAVVTFDMKEEEGIPYRIYEIKLHFRDTDKKRLIDTLDLTIYDVDQDGDKVKNEYKTKWANKENLSEEDKAEMKRAKEYFEELAESGYVG